MKLYIFCCVLVTCHGILVDKENTFLITENTNVTEYLQNFTMKEVRGGSRLKCGSQCSEHERCAAFMYHNNRCILIGSSTLPGNDVNANDISTSVVHKKRGYRGKLKGF